MKSRYLEVQGSWLHRIFLLRHLLEAEIDEAFADAAWPPAKRIVFYNEVDAGLGDVAFMTKLLTLVAAASDAPELVLVSTGIEKQSRFRLPEGIVVIPAAEAVGHSAVVGCDLVVSAPGIFDHCRNGVDVLRILGLPSTTPFLYIAEYGSIRQLRDDAFKGHLASIEAARDVWLDEMAAEAGVDPDDVGFRPNSGEVVVHGEHGPPARLGHLNRVFFDVQRPANPLATWLAQTSLNARSCGLEPGEIGVHIDPQLLERAQQVAKSATLRRLLASEIEHPSVRAAVLEAIDAQTSVYHGYAHSGHRVFHDLVSALEAARGRDVLLVIPDARPADRILRDDFPEAIRDRLASRGFGGVEIVGRGSETSLQQNVSEAWGDGPRYRLNSNYPLSHGDMKLLMAISEPPTMVSGDQSFSDAVSALKALAVIEPVYCQTWHLDAVCSMAESADARFAAVLKAGLAFEWSATAVDAVLPAIREPAVWESAIALSAHIADAHSTNGPIVHAIKRTLWSSDQTHGLGVQAWLGEVVCRGLAGLANAEGGHFSLRDAAGRIELPLSIPRRSIGVAALGGATYR